MVKTSLTTLTGTARVASVALRAIPFVGLAAAAVAGLSFLAEKLDSSIINKAPVAKDELTGMFNAGKEGSNVLRASLRDFDGIFAIASTAGTAYGEIKVGLDGASASGENFRNVLRAVSDRFPDIRSGAASLDIFEKYFSGKDYESFTQFENQLRGVGEALGEQADKELPAATAAFKDMTDEFSLTREESLALLDQMPAFADSLRRQAIEAGLAGTEQDILNIALQQGGDFFAAAGDAASPYVQILEELEREAEESARRVRELEDALFDFGSGALDSRAAARRLEEEKARLKDTVTKLIEEEGSLAEALNESKTGFDITTDAGRDLQDQVDGLAKSLVDQAEANYELSGSEEELREDFAKAREALLDQLETLGFTEEAAQNLADTIIGNPYEIDLKIDEITKEEADAALRELNATLARAQQDYRDFLVDIETGSAFDLNAAGIISRIDAGQRLGTEADRARRGFSLGGFVSGAGTGTSDSIPALLSNGEFVVNSRATRDNRALLEAINSSKDVSLRPSIAVTVNPSQGMDEKELAELVSRKIAFDIRRGSI